MRRHKNKRRMKSQTRKTLRHGRGAHNGNADSPRGRRRMNPVMSIARRVHDEEPREC